MKCYIGLGSNMGDRKALLEQAAQELALLSENKQIRVSPVYETPALVPSGAPPSWLKPFSNAAVEIEWNGPPLDLLAALKKIESRLGRVEAERWAPRPIDLDILIFGDITMAHPNLNLPHAGLLDRAFALDPLKDLAPTLIMPQTGRTSVVEARQLPAHRPWIMGILNITPDSFSDGGELSTNEALEQRLTEMDKAGIQAIDLGAESTRPGATPLNSSEEWNRLLPVLEVIQARYAAKLVRPFISLDTYRPEIAKQALAYGIDAINDVSGVSNPKMTAVIRESGCHYVLMHSLTVPADPTITLSESTDVVQVLKSWLAEKLAAFERDGISLNKIIFDPGLGFGKTPSQSLEILKRAKEFSDFPVRLFVGHSRKGFTKNLGAETREQKDLVTLAISLELARKGVDILRVHDFKSHALAFRARAEVLT